MAMLILDAYAAENLKEERRARGIDLFDEVWEGVYVMSPLADIEHQIIVSGLTGVFQAVIVWPGLGLALAGVNISDRVDDWTQNYRIPDVAVFLRDTAARDCGTHWVGGPDFAVEITSGDDRTRDKLPFYAAGGTRELLLVEREPWSLTLYRLRNGVLTPVGTSTLEAPEAIPSEVVPLSFRLAPGDPRPRIEVRHHDGAQRWAV
jgi:hypothetical protein